LKSLLLCNLSSFRYAILTWGKIPETYLTHPKVLHNRSLCCICRGESKPERPGTPFRSKN